MRNVYAVVSTIVLYLFIGCNVSMGKTGKLAVAGNATADLLYLDDELPLPVPPDSLNGGNAKIAFILQHFWDTLDFAADNRALSQNFLEQNFSNFIAILPYADADDRSVAVSTLVNAAAANPEALNLLADVAELYLYDLDSPFRNSESYALFADAFVSNPAIYDERRERLNFQMEEMNKNRPGDIAADFSFSTPDGCSFNLLDFDAPGYLLLIFYNPNCENCHKIIEALSDDARLNSMIDAGELTALAVYSGENHDAWLRNAPSMPARWTIGYEPGKIDEEELYIFRSTPSIYLLDAQKRVIAKDIKPDWLFDMM